MASQSIRRNAGKEQLRALLRELGPRMGLWSSAVEELVRQAQVAHWRRDQEIFAADDTSDLVNFLIAGAVKVTCPTGEGTVCVQMVRPGQFFGLNWYAERGQTRHFIATAFTDSVIATLTSQTTARIIASAPPRSALQLVSYISRALSGLLYEKCCLLGLGLEDRLLHELGVLARDFGRRRPQGGGVVIDLPLTHRDLGELALASRANVARVMKRLERGGVVGRDGRRVVLTERFFDAEGKHVARLLRNGPTRTPRRVA